MNQLKNKAKTMNRFSATHVYGQLKLNVAD